MRSLCRPRRLTRRATLRGTLGRCSAGVAGIRIATIIHPEPGEAKISIRYADFQGEIAILAKTHIWNPNLNAELAAVSTALASDTRTHDKTIQAAPAGLQITIPTGTAPLTRLTNALNLVVNKGLAGNLPTASMVAAIDGVAGVLSPPGNIDVPYASANASPPVVGTVCTVTLGNWAGTPTSYTYQWTRNGTNIATGATSSSYTLVSADTGGKQIACVVTATNVTGSTAAPPSNAIAVP